MSLVQDYGVEEKPEMNKPAARSARTKRRLSMDGETNKVGSILTSG